jgi:cytochrome c oxidase subunit 4
MIHHVDSVKTYGLVFAGLIILTIVTTAVSFVDLGPFSVVAALVIATCKMLLVALFFMHLRHSTVLTRLVVIGGLLWLVILLGLSFADFATRGALNVPGR